ncbi:MAG: CoA transferase subunit A [Vicinamibacteria bacterium]
MSEKLMSMREAISRFVDDGDVVLAEGFTHLIPFAAGHEIIRQRKKDLTLCRLTPDLIYDQMVAAGVARKLVFSWTGNPGVGSLHAIRRAVEKQIPHEIEIEEYSHFGLATRIKAGASGLPFLPLRTYHGTDLPRVNDRIKPISCPFTGEELYAVPALKPDVAILHAQRADGSGNTQVWGLLGVQKEAAFAARKVIVVVEEIVDEELVRKDPNRTLFPGVIVDAVVEEPFGAHPSFVQGYYDRDNDFYVAWEDVSRAEEGLKAYLDEWVYGVEGRAEYAEKLGPTARMRLTPEPFPSPSVSYGLYR